MLRYIISCTCLCQNNCRKKEVLLSCVSRWKREKVALLPSQKAIMITICSPKSSIFAEEGKWKKVSTFSPHPFTLMIIIHKRGKYVYYKKSITDEIGHFFPLLLPCFCHRWSDSRSLTFFLWFSDRKQNSGAQQMVPPKKSPLQSFLFYLNVRNFSHSQLFYWPFVNWRKMEGKSQHKMKSSISNQAKEDFSFLLLLLSHFIGIVEKRRGKKCNINIVPKWHSFTLKRPNRVMYKWWSVGEKQQDHRSFVDLISVE